MLLEEVMRGARDKGATVKAYDLNDPGFRGCQGCFYCRKNPGCSVEDTLSSYYKTAGEVKGIVFASPIYFGDISGQGKMWLDRMFPMQDGKSFSPRYPGKRVVGVFAQGDGNPGRFKPAIDRFEGFMRIFGWKVEETIVCGGVSAPGFSLPAELKERAFRAGERLAEG
jgi:multimeric flavodoxin WrbA